MEDKRVYIHTIGCQMNVHDSDRIASLMRGIGYRDALFPEDADLIFVNTCTVRDKAQQKAFSFLGRLLEIKKKKPGLIIAAVGCVAQQEANGILKRLPHVDLVAGTQAYGRLPKIIEKINRRRCRVVDVGTHESPHEKTTFFSRAPGEKNSAASRFVSIMQGCDNFCTYCIVPYVRGRERSRNPEEILSEIRSLVASGVREVFLLGQNVNSYGIKENIGSFAELLKRIHEIDGLRRIRFTTSHPKDLSDDLVEAFGRLEKLCRHIHLPVQSGSDRILSRMHRRYTRDHYVDRVAALRRACPDIAVSTDLIVGFPGETDTDFRQTVELMGAVEFDSVFAFKYSDRKGTKAALMTQKVPEATQAARLKALFDFQRSVTLQKNRALIGTIQEILVEGPSLKEKKQGSSEVSAMNQWTGRNSGNKVVNFRLNGNSNSCDSIYPGALVNVRIRQAFPNSLSGELHPCP